MISFHAMMGTFIAASIQGVFVDIAEDLDVSVQRASYLLTLTIAVLGVAPLFWCPLSQRFGRRPIFLVSLICSLVGNVGCAVSPSYSTMAFCRAIATFFISPPLAIGSAVAAETFFKKERARYMGVWAMMATLGVPLGPFIFGFVAVRIGYRWIYWILAIVSLHLPSRCQPSSNHAVPYQTNGIQLLVYFFLGRETLYLRGPTPSSQPPPPAANPSLFKSLMSFRRIDPTPLALWDFIQPLSFFARPCVIVPTAGYAMIYLWGNIMMCVATGALFPQMFGLDPQQVGLQNISLIVGSVIGEQIGGAMSDWWMWRRQKALGAGGSESDSQGERSSAVKVQPEFRLWVGYLGQLLTICGVVVYLVQLGRAGDSWNVTPVVGSGIAAAGNQIVTTVVTTYAVDCYREDAASVGVFINFVRQTWGFIGPFWINDMLQNVGFDGSAGITTALMVVVSLIPTAVVQWRGQRWR